VLFLKTGNISSLEECPVIEKRIVSSFYCRLTLKASALIREAYPGQFVMVYMPPGHRYMLPRPFSIFGLDRQKGEFSLFFAIKGQGTKLLAGASPGSVWKILGPLGKGFPSLPQKSLLVAGGMGIAPLVFLAASTETPRILIYGARTADQLVCPPDDLKLPGLTVIETTEDGSRGEKGSAVDLLARSISASGALFACGPRPMLRKVVSISDQNCLETWVSLEERMACGIGACLGCAVAVSDGYRSVCSDGPVFSAREVVFND
jgi:dihydroorotate dehydrogenase electron transfer subunit